MQRCKRPDCANHRVQIRNPERNLTRFPTIREPLTGPAISHETEILRKSGFTSSGARETTTLFYRLHLSLKCPGAEKSAEGELVKRQKWCW